MKHCSVAVLLLCAVLALATAAPHTRAMWHRAGREGAMWYPDLKPAKNTDLDRDTQFRHRSAAKTSEHEPALLHQASYFPDLKPAAEGLMDLDRALQQAAKHRDQQPAVQPQAAFPDLKPASEYSSELEQAIQHLASEYSSHMPVAAQNLEQATLQAADYRDHKPADLELVANVKHAVPDVIANLEQAVQRGQHQFASITALEAAAQPDEEPSDKNFIACTICKNTCSSACEALLSLKGTGFLCDVVICPKIVCRTVCD